MSAGAFAVGESGGTGVGVTAKVGGTLNVLAGGTANGDTVSGQQTIYGSASGTIIDSGGEELVASGAGASVTTVSSGGLKRRRRRGPAQQWWRQRSILPQASKKTRDSEPPAVIWHADGAIVDFEYAGNSPRTLQLYSLQLRIEETETPNESKCMPIRAPEIGVALDRRT